ncbi:uncharacterized protein HHUB_4235 (plasmid) [Halobacterium hubeiense]|uniref:Uncharacterized protein n=1 Tax=Halobacterium hubeiense TaxID=1407499 RepID=A0A0U5D1X0_9EURY|nr:hypothetical protein [Halobacterium hubeiense]CQH63949.1 uncharacterized protein HHUB_4235 [Halobacterium hubeiense]
MPGIKAAVKNAIIGLIKDLVGGLAGIIDFLFQIAKNYLTSTPYPDNLSSFNPPTKGLWPKLYHNLYDELVIVLLPSLFALALGLAMFFNIFSEKQKRVSIRRAVFAYPLALSWWWFGGWFLKFINDLAGLIVADAAVKGSLGTNLGSSLGAVAVSVLIYIFGATIILVIIGIYLLRQLAIYAYMAAMPILLMFWIVPIQPVQGWAKSMMGKFVPLVLMTLPTAFLLRIGSLFLTGGQNPAAAATSSGDLSTDLVSTIFGLATIAGAGLVPKYVFSFSSQVSRAVRKGTPVARRAAGGAYAGADTALAGNPRERQSARPARGSRRGSSSTAETSDEHRHEPDLDFSSQRQRRSRRRRRRERAEKAGEKMGSKAVNAPARVSQSAIRNYRGDSFTPVGMAGDAGKATASKVDSYRQRINERMAIRSEEVREKFTPGGDGPPSRGQSSLDDYAGSQTDAETDTETDVDTDADAGLGEESSESVSSGETASGSRGEDSDLSTDERAMDNQPDDARMDSSDLTESAEEWSRSNADTAEFNTRTEDHSSPDADETSDG